MSEDEAERRTNEALASAGLADMRPAYRKLLVRLKRERPADFAEATRRYREDLEPSVAAGDVDPIMAWIEYGRWLAHRLTAGRVLAIDETGRARPYEVGVRVPGAYLILHLPDDGRTPAILLASPSNPSEPQRLTTDLLTH